MRNYYGADELHAMQGGLCYLCGGPMSLDKADGAEVATVDHLTPISRGGTQDDDNRKAVHMRCNQDKRAMTLDEFRHRETQIAG